MTEGKLMLAGGDYFIGDPCYAFGAGDGWDDFLRQITDHVMDGPASRGRFRGHECFVHSTAMGDGSYGLEKNGVYMGVIEVESGLIGCFPADMVEAIADESECSRHMLIKHRFEEDFEVDYASGHFLFGDCEVATDTPEMRAKIAELMEATK